VADVPQQLGFYERLLPTRERPVEALGGVLNGIAIGCGILCLLWWPLFFGVVGIACGGLSLVFARDRGVQSRFALGFAIAGVGWMIGMILAVSGHQLLAP